MTRAAFLTGLGLLLAGCTGIGAGLFRTEVPETDRWLVAPMRAGPAAPDAGSLHLAVPAFHVSHAFADRSFVYRQADGRWDSDPWRELLVPPGEMLADATRLWLRDSGLFATVQAGESRRAPDLVLEADVTALYGDYTEETATAVVSLRVLVLDPDTRVRHRAVYARRRPLPDDAPGTLAAGWTEALREILTELERDLVEVAQGKRAEP